MGTAKYWACPVYDHRWPAPPEWDFYHCHYCKNNKEVRAEIEAAAKETGKNPEAAWTRPPGPYKSGFVRWCWECTATTSANKTCGFLVWWNDKKCHNTQCNGTRSANATWSSKSDRPGLFYGDSPTIGGAEWEAMTDAEKEAHRKRKAAGKKHRPVDGCPVDCPGPHDFSLNVRVLTEDPDEFNAEILADVIPPVDPKGSALEKGKIQWEAQGEFAHWAKGDGGKTMTTAGDDNRHHIEAVGPGRVTAICRFEFGKEKFPDPKKKKRGKKDLTTDRVYLEFGELEFPETYKSFMRYLEEGIPKQMSFEDRKAAGIPYPSGRRLAQLEDGWVRSYGAEAQFRGQNIQGGNAEWQRKKFREAKAHALRVLHFRRCVRESAVMLEGVLDEYLDTIKGALACTVESSLPIAKKIVDAVLRDGRTSEREVSWSDLAGRLDLSHEERMRGGYLVEGHINALKPTSTYPQIIDRLTLPSMSLARSILYEDYGKISWEMGKHLDEINRTFSFLATALRDYAEGDEWHDKTNLHVAREYMEDVSDIPDAVYGSFFGRGEKGWGDWDGVLIWETVSWYDQPVRDPDALRGTRMENVRAALSKVSLPSSPSTRLVGLLPHYEQPTYDKAETHKDVWDPFSAWKDPYEQKGD